MKKYLLSAVVTGLFVVPSAYAMDGGAAPAVEIEVPAVEVDAATDDVAVDTGAVDDVKLDAVDAAVDVDVQVETVEVSDDSGIRYLGAPEIMVCIDPLPVEDAPVTNVDDVVLFKHFDVLEAIPVDENGVPVESIGGSVDSLGQVMDYPVEGEAVDPNLVDLASQSGIAVEDNGIRIQPYDEPEVCTFPLVITVDGPVDCPVGGVDENGHQVWLVSSGVEPVDGNGEPVVFQTFGNIDGGELPQGAPVDGGGEVEVTSLDDAPIRSHGEIQPNFRSGLTDRGAEAFSAAASNVVAVGDSDAPNAQLLNDEQRGAVRGLRSDEESAKPRAGLGKLMAKFRKPKSQVTLASGTADLALSSKLAEVDRLRDTALRTGDQKALAKADKLEKELRAKSGKVTKIPTRTK